MALLDERYAYARWSESTQTSSSLGNRGVGAGAGAFFAILPGITDIHRAVAQMQRTLTVARSHRDPFVRSRVAPMIQRAIVSLGADIKASEWRIAEAADQFIRERIDATRVRPARTGEMAKAIRSRPLPAGVFPGLSVGIAELRYLDDPSAGQGRLRYYWRTQEFGSDHIRDPSVYRNGPPRGFFMPGNAPPDPSLFRVHPFFRTEAGGPVMMPRKPIPERAFLREGSWKAVQLWRREGNRIVREADRYGLVIESAVQTSMVRAMAPGASRRRR